jgi:hypothetical protein
MSESNYERGFSEGAKEERYRIIRLLKNYKDGLYEEAAWLHTKDPAYYRAGANAVERCLAELARLEGNEIPIDPA